LLQQSIASSFGGAYGYRAARFEVFRGPLFDPAPALRLNAEGSDRRRSLRPSIPTRKELLRKPLDQSTLTFRAGLRCVFSLPPHRSFSHIRTGKR
jgi:hypothetical protein